MGGPQTRRMMTQTKVWTLSALLVWLVATASSSSAFLAVSPMGSRQTRPPVVSWSSVGPPPGDDDGSTSREGADLAAEFFKMAQRIGVNVGADDLILMEDDDDEALDDDEDDEEDDDEPEMNFPQGAVNAFLGYDTGNVGEKLAGNVTLTNNQLYSEVKERVLDTAGGFVDFVTGAKEDDEEEEEENETPKEYQTPTTVPDPELTAGEVVLVVIEALNNNDKPTPNRGVEVYFGYASPSNTIRLDKGLTPKEYAEFLKDTEYKILFDHQAVSIEKGDYSYDGKKAFFTARLKVGPELLDVVPVNFILSSTQGVSEESCWLVDSMLIRPQSMRRRRRK